MTIETRGRKRVYDRDATHRLCRECDETLLVSDFNPNRVKSNGYTNIETRCIGCMRARKYGTTKAIVQSMLADQKNACAICKSPFRNAKDTHVDHCHSTGAIRGILCMECNTGLGKFKDNIGLLLTAIDYLS